MATLAILVLGAAWGGPSGVSGGGENPMVIANPGASPEAMPVLQSHSDNPASGAYRRHASLAFFSLGSLAVGGVFYGISGSLDRSNVAYTAGDRTRISAAVGAAGITALIAAGSFFFFANREAQKPRKWDAQVTGSLAPGSGMKVAAALALPLPSLIR